MKSSTSIFGKNWSAEFHFRRGREVSMNISLHRNRLTFFLNPTKSLSIRAQLTPDALCLHSNPQATTRRAFQPKLEIHPNPNSMEENRKLPPEGARARRHPTHPDSKEITLSRFMAGSLQMWSLGVKTFALPSMDFWCSVFLQVSEGKEWCSDSSAIRILIPEFSRESHSSFHQH